MSLSSIKPYLPSKKLQAIIVLVLIVIGATSGFGRVSDFFSNLGGGKSNVQTVIQGCQVACQTNSEYDWCSRTRQIRTGDDTSSGLVDRQSYTCAQLVTHGVQGLEQCSTISVCDTVAGELTVTLVSGALIANEADQNVVVRVTNDGSQSFILTGLMFGEVSAWATSISHDESFSSSSPLSIPTGSSELIELSVSTKQVASGERTIPLRFATSGETIDESITVTISAQ